MVESDKAQDAEKFWFSCWITWARNTLRICV